MRRTKSQIRAAQIAELLAEQEAYDKRVQDAVKSAAFARCDAVEQLYELLDVRPEKPIMRDGKNGRYEVATDKDETKRAARLLEAVSGLLAEKDERAVTPVAIGGGHPADAARQQRQPMSEPRTASAAPRYDEQLATAS